MSHLCLNNLHARKYIDTDFFNQKYHAYNVAKLIKYQHFVSLNCYMIFPIKYSWMWNYRLPSSVSVLSIWAKNCGWDFTIMILWLLAYTDQLADIPEYILSNMLEYTLWTYIKGYIISMKSSCKVNMKRSAMPAYLSTLSS